MRHIVLIFTAILLFSCKKEEKIQVAPAIQVIKMPQLEKYMTASDATYVVNFWATWCKPCVDELPAFQAVHENPEGNSKVILVSLDDVDKKDKVLAFAKAEQLSAPIEILDEPYANEWIPKVDPHWDGAIPITLIIKDGKKRFYERTFTESELREIIKS